jgi:hypothetical protein
MDEVELHVPGRTTAGDLADLLEAINAARDEHRVTWVLSWGRRVAMIVPCGSLETGYSELEAALAELARLQEPYQRQLVRVRELIAQENASLQG